MLRQLSGIEKADGGVEINGLCPVKNAAQFKECVGVVFQKHNLFPHLSILENITFILHKIKKENKEVSTEKAITLFKQLKIDQQAHKKPNEIS